MKRKGNLDTSANTGVHDSFRTKTFQTWQFEPLRPASRRATIGRLPFFFFSLFSSLKASEIGIWANSLARLPEIDARFSVVAAVLFYCSFSFDVVVRMVLRLSTVDHKPPEKRLRPATGALAFVSLLASIVSPRNPHFEEQGSAVNRNRGKQTRVAKLSGEAVLKAKKFVHHDPRAEEGNISHPPPSCPRQ